jgi:drug/metabolite transporter (DMT)-like permease
VLGTLLALLAAISFGLSTPLIQRLSAGVGPFSTASMLYTGAGVLAWISRKKIGVEPPLRASHLPRLLAIGLTGAFIAPAALAFGLARTSGVAASLMLNLEAAFTIALGWFLYHEHVPRRVVIAASLLLLGGGLLVLDRGAITGADLGGPSSSGLLGLAAVLLATLAWALDNALARPLADVDPSRVVLAKCVIGAGVSLAMSIEAREGQAPASTTSLLMLLGAVSYGLSLRLYYLAQRRIGAARTASVFASGPFIGALLAVGLGEPLGGAFSVLGAGLMIAGVVLHLTERHAHEHQHEEIEHEHAHRHDDGHHDDHAHDPMPEGEHSHKHRHDPRKHSHPHAPDLHHGHRHDD